MAATITIAETDPKLGDWVTPVVTGLTRKSKNRSPNRWSVTAYQSTGCAQGTIEQSDGTFLTYAMAENIPNPILLGGGSSCWLDQGGPAHCRVALFYFDNTGPTQQYVELSHSEFDAAG